MTVAELIDQLKNYKPDTPVLLEASDHRYIPVAAAWSVDFVPSKDNTEPDDNEDPKLIKEGICLE